MAYNTATVAEAFTEGDGRTRLRIRYTGNAGEEPVLEDLYINQSTAPDPDFIRGQAKAKIDTLNQNRTVASSFAVPFVLDTTTPVASAAARPTTIYAAASTPFTPGATPQDVFTITGSASKTVTVLSAGIATVQTTAGVNHWQLVKRSAANTGGTSVVVAAVPIDDSFAAATATVRQYTANPTAGPLSAISGQAALRRRPPRPRAWAILVPTSRQK